MSVEGRSVSRAARRRNPPTRLAGNRWASRPAVVSLKRSSRALERVSKSASRASINPRPSRATAWRPHSEVRMAGSKSPFGLEGVSLIAARIRLSCRPAPSELFPTSPDWSITRLGSPRRDRQNRYNPPPTLTDDYLNLLKPEGPVHDHVASQAWPAEPFFRHSPGRADRPALGRRPHRPGPPRPLPGHRRRTLPQPPRRVRRGHPLQRRPGTAGGEAGAGDGRTPPTAARPAAALGRPPRRRREGPATAGGRQRPAAFASALRAGQARRRRAGFPLFARLGRSARRPPARPGRR